MNTTSASPLAATPAALVSQFIADVFNQGDLAALERYIAPSYRYHSPSEELVGIAALRTFIADLRTAFPDMHVAVVDQVGDAHKVCTRVTLTGTHRGTFASVPATQRAVKVDGVIISEVSAGRITREWELLDQLTMFQQLGLLPTEDATASSK
ncbi:ester cyclase [Actomonas aquatica]|uniref:Ester cyclase n=1 Tax=Actomonas aquatica TaxID=2866162 RepID=A0ABZ1C287_9BACT|nr:ester cyclase [Opitutus sp. WL0086]WRQ85609.1 ester cyclase [Opitutus sp. WL0086]